MFVSDPHIGIPYDGRFDNTEIVNCFRFDKWITGPAKPEIKDYEDYERKISSWLIFQTPTFKCRDMVIYPISSSNRYVILIILNVRRVI